MQNRKPMVLVLTVDPKINITHIESRVALGGHDVEKSCAYAGGPISKKTFFKMLSKRMASFFGIFDGKPDTLVIEYYQKAKRRRYESN